MNVNEYLIAQHKGSDAEFLIAARITCADGFTLSVQASKGHYCEPRSNQGPWTKVEVGFPSSAPELITEYAEDSNDTTGTVYPFVPVNLVDDLITLHGGIKA